MKKNAIHQDARELTKSQETEVGKNCMYLQYMQCTVHQSMPPPLKKNHLKMRINKNIVKTQPHVHTAAAAVLGPSVCSRMQVVDFGFMVSADQFG